MAEEEFELPPTWQDDVKARLKELGISQSTMARALDHSQKHITMVLNGMAAPSLGFLNQILYYVGLDLTTRPSIDAEGRSTDGHWFYRERCQHCGVNMYDSALYDADKECSK